MTLHTLFMSALLLPVLAACGSPPDAPEQPGAATAALSCASSKGVTPICGLQAPEDIAAHPDGRHLLISQTNGPVRRGRSSIALLNIDSGALRVLDIRVEPRIGWGDPTCSQPRDEFEFHGIDATRLADGTLRLLAVNHGGREAVEQFELVDAAASLVWRGCVLTQQEWMANDVASTAEGGFIVTEMITWEKIRAHSSDMLSGVNTGHVMAWSPGAGLRKLPDSAGPTPNGAVVLPDGRYAFVANWSGRKITKYDLQAQRKTAEAPLDFLPDNLSLSPNGRIIAAGISTADLARRCMQGSTIDNMEQNCNGPVRVAAVDPVSLKVHNLLDGHEGVLPGVTVAVQVGNRLYVGSGAGDRIVRFDIAAR